MSPGPVCFVAREQLGGGAALVEVGARQYYGISTPSGLTERAVRCATWCAHPLHPKTFPVAGTVLQPGDELLEISLLFRRRIGDHLGIASQRHHVEVNTNEPIGIRMRKS